VDDQQLWDLGLRHLKALYAGFSTETERGAAELLARYSQRKEALAAVIAGIDASALCQQCGGQCCMNSKYRINVFDALAFIVRKTLPSADFIQKPVCPYGSHDGCNMEPELRPADCILFLCDTLDEKISPHFRMILAAGEEDLRECIEQASRLIGEQVHAPFLLWAEKQRYNNPKV
jgi:hypothetical protein